VSTARYKFNMWVLSRPIFIFKVFTMFSEIHGFEDAIYNIILLGRSRWPCGLKRGSATACLLGWWVRIPLGTWMSVFCEYCVLSGRGLCVGYVTGPEEPPHSGVSECDCEAWTMRRLWFTTGCCIMEKDLVYWSYAFILLVLCYH
jgi:hypothetical protein